MTSNVLGVFWALIAMISWGFGDYFIQKVSRIDGIWKTLFFISVIGSIGLLPFVASDIPKLANLHGDLFIGLAAMAMTISSVFYFEALEEGKLTVMEPVLSLELPLAAILAVVLWGESLGWVGWLLVLGIFIGNTLAVTEHHKNLHYHKRLFEKGVIYALAAALCMAFVDFLMGASSQQNPPLLTVWVVWVFSGIVSFLYLAHQGKIMELKNDFRNHRSAILALGIFDTMGWVGFCLAASRIPIAITTAIGESYIVITLFLGLFVNHERLRSHQRWGVGFAVLSVIVLAALTG